MCGWEKQPSFNPAEDSPESDLIFQVRHKQRLCYLPDVAVGRTPPSSFRETMLVEVARSDGSC